MKTPAISGYQFAVIRIALSVYLFCHFAGLWPHAIEIFSNEGMFHSQSTLPTLNILPNLFSISDTPMVVHGVLITSLVCTVMLMLGISRRWVALILWICWLSFFNRNPFISNPSIPFIGVALLLMAALPHGEPWARRPPMHNWQVPNWVASGTLLLLMLGYTISGLHKLTASTWVDGTALTHVLHLPIARDNWIRDLFLHQPTWFIKGATWGALTMELLALPMSLNRKLRPWIWLGLFTMNIGILFVIDFADLTFGVLLFHFFVFDGRWLPGRRFESEHPTVFFDGICNLCNHTVNFIMSEDQHERFKFAPVQGTTAELITAQEVRSGESMALMDGEKLYTKSDAVLMIAAGLGGIWRVLSWSRFIPSILRNTIYFQVQKNRYSIFGKADTCRLPTPEERARFLP